MHVQAEILKWWTLNAESRHQPKVWAARVAITPDAKMRSHINYTLNLFVFVVGVFCVLLGKHFSFDWKFISFEESFLKWPKMNRTRQRNQDVCMCFSSYFLVCLSWMMLSLEENFNAVVVIFFYSIFVIDHNHNMTVYNKIHFKIKSFYKILEFRYFLSPVRITLKYKNWKTEWFLKVGKFLFCTLILKIDYMYECLIYQSK